MSEPVYTYFMFSPKMNCIKIGKSSQPAKRLRELQTGNADTLQIIGQLAGNHESALHVQFEGYRVFPGEWFRADGPGLRDFLKSQFGWQRQVRSAKSFLSRPRLYRRKTTSPARTF
jgi:hypothetical protein